MATDADMVAKFKTLKAEHRGMINETVQNREELNRTHRYYEVKIETKARQHYDELKAAKVQIAKLKAKNKAEVELHHKKLGAA